MENLHRDTETQPLIDLIAKARRMVGAGQGNTLIVIGDMRITARGLVSAGDHLSELRLPLSPWQEFLRDFNTTTEFALKRISLIAAVLLLLTLVCFGVILTIQLNRPDILALPTPVGQILQPDEKQLLERLTLSNRPSDEAKAVAQHLLEGSCPSMGVWRNNSGSRLLVCFTRSGDPGALKFVKGEFSDGGAFTIQNLHEFVDAHGLVKIYGGD